MSTVLAKTRRKGRTSALQQSLTGGQQVLLALLLIAVMGSAMGVVYTRFQARTLFTELSELQNRASQMAVEWDRLQLEEATYATHGYIENKARNELDMVVPEFDQMERVAR
jgi:cell division protein FtsL